MKLLHPARHLAEAHLLRGYLESCGITTVIRGEALAGGIGELPVDVCGVWVCDETRFTEASRLLQDFFRDQPEAGAGWRCDTCGESLEAQFTACWNCGQGRG